MKRLKRKAPLLGIAVLLLVAFVGGTFAYFSQTSTAENYLTALKYDSTITEAFTPPADGAFAPGVQINKKVGVTNTGDVPMFVRITYDEYWTAFNGEPSTYPAVNLLAEYADKDSSNLYDNDITRSYVQKYTSSSDWMFNDVDGYYYYDTIVIPDGSTTPFIDYIMLNNSLNTSTTTYTINYFNGTSIVAMTGVLPANLDSQKTTIIGTTGNYLVNVISNVTSGAPEGNYRLVFTTETVQAIPDGLNSWGLATTSPIYIALSALIPASLTTP